MGARRGRLLRGAVLLFSLAVIVLVLATREGARERGRLEGRRATPAATGANGEEVATPRPDATRPADRSPVPEDASPPTGSPPAFVLPGVEGIVHVPEGCHPDDVSLALDPPLPGAPPVPDVGGRFVFRDVPAGRYRLTAVHPECMAVGVKFEVAPDREPPSPELFLRRGGSLRVVVQGADGLPVPGQHIELRHSGPVKVSGAPPFRTADTDDEGAAVFPRLSPGRYEIVRVSPDPPAQAGAEGAMRTAQIEPEKETVVVIELGCRLEGFLAGPDGRPLAGAIVRMLPAVWGPEGYRHEKTTTDEAGEFTLDGFAPGRYRINIQVLGKPSYVVTVAVLEFAPGQVRNETIRVRAGGVRGRIRLEGVDGDALELARRGSGLQVQARRVEVDADGAVVQWLPGGGTAYADAEGCYELVGLEPGWYSLWFPGPTMEWEDLTRVIDFKGGGWIEDLDVRLTARATAVLVLVVRDPDGGPAAGVDFGLAVGTGSRSLIASGGGRGRWRITVPAGPQAVIVDRPGFHARVEIDLAAGEETVREVTLQPIER